MNAVTPSVAQATLQGLRDIVGAAHVIVDADTMAPYLVEERGLYRGAARAIVRPGSTQEVSRVLAYCNSNGVKIVPQGGNTGLVGGQVPSLAGDEIVLSLRRMDRIREIDATANILVVDAGVTLMRAQEEADKVDRLFPLSLPSEGSCTIGGNLSTNAGGVAAVAYGVARDLAAADRKGGGYRDLMLRPFVDRLIGAHLEGSSRHDHHFGAIRAVAEQFSGLKPGG